MNAARPRSISLFLAAALLVPLAAAAVLGWSIADRESEVSAIPVAIVNDDEIVTGDTPMAAGRALSGALIHPDGDTLGLGWTLTSADDAQEGLDSGDYYAVLTIPADFSASVLSVGTDDPVSAELTLETNPAASAVGGLAAQVVAQTAATTLGDSITNAYVTASAAGMGEVSASLSAAADGAVLLADGAAQAAEGAGQLSAAASELSTGMSQLETATNGVAGGTQGIADGAQGVATGATQLATAQAQLATGAQSASAGAAGVAGGATTLADTLSGLAASCPAASSSVEFCATLTAASQGATALAGSATQVAAGASQVATGAQGTADASAQLAAGATGLADGAAQLAAGAAQTATGAAQASTGAAQLAAGTAQFAEGQSQLADGASELAEGLEEGAAQVPVYTDQQADALAAVVTDPVELVTDATSSAQGWIAALIATVVLWLGTLATLMVGRRPYDRAALDSPATTSRLLVLLLRPRLGIAGVQALVTVAAIGAFGFELDSAVALTGVALLGAAAFTTLLSGLEALFGRYGMLVFAVVTAAQIAASALVPIQTAPPTIEALNGMLPANAFITLAAGIAGDPTGASVVGGVVTLVVWTVIGVAMVGIGIRRRRSRSGMSRASAAATGALRGRMAA
ncbi:hypothetical protein GCM10009808_16040 [Microbacterium sediminicola]|uniref:YhgE/Pip domain-containing protein n=1 Tax=Microbacterium sediminicola TaxID=415210 RepID=A0ABN2I5Z9_9MICO